MNFRLCHTKTAAHTHDIVSNAPAVNTINRHDVFISSLLHPI